MALKLKQEYNNSLVKRGTVIFDSSKILQRHYKAFSDNGFADLFYEDSTINPGSINAGISEVVIKEEKKESPKKR
jgi:hypothetical protein